jgi:hypothetical protein
MANSYVEYTGNGSTTAYAIPFSYISASHVTATVNGVATTITISGTTATFSSAPASSATIRILRKSSQTSRLVDYTQPSTLTEEDLDTDSLQAFYIAQEAVDKVSDTIGKSESTLQWDALSKRINNVTDPTSAQDASTKAYTDAQVAGTTTNAAAAATSAAAAATQATAAATSATAAAGSATTSAGHVTTASNYAVKVDGVASGSDHSSKAWAIGGTGITDTSAKGAAKEWAIEAEDNTVDGSEYSAKHYSIKAAAQASAAASSATAAASGQIYSTVVNQSAATLSPALSANGTYYLCDTSSNNITVTLPAIGTSEGFKFAFQKTHASNSLIFQRSGSDTLNGSSSNITLTDVDSNIIFVADDNSPDNWVGTLLSQITAGSGITKTGSVLTLDLTNDQAWTGSQRSTPVADNDGSFDMNAGNNFNWTPSGADVIEFTNETAGQGGLIYLVNASNHAITKGSEVKCDANFLATVSATGNYLISYYSFDGTSVVVANTLAVS